MKEQPQWYRPVKVFCSHCKEWIDESTVKFLDISEDVYGRDRLSFECPQCKTQQDSLRIG